VSQNSWNQLRFKIMLAESSGEDSKQLVPVSIRCHHDGSRGPSWCFYVASKESDVVKIIVEEPCFVGFPNSYVRVGGIVFRLFKMLIENDFRPLNVDVDMMENVWGEVVVVSTVHSAVHRANGYFKSAGLRERIAYDDGTIILV
jgi:hypothetical protein